MEYNGGLISILVLLPEYNSAIINTGEKIYISPMRAGGKIDINLRNAKNLELNFLGNFFGDQVQGQTQCKGMRG